MEFRSPKTNDDLKNLKVYNWDATIGIAHKPMLVGRLDGFMHTSGGKWGENCFYCWPREEKPTIDNITPYDGDGGASWGVEYRETQHYNNHMGDIYVETSGCTVITRNGIDFYTVRGKLDYSMPKAISIMKEINEGPINFNEIEYANNDIIGRKILYKNYPGIITLWCEGQGCIIVEYDGDPEYKEDAIRLWNNGLDDDDSIKLDIIGYDHSDIDWYPDNRKPEVHDCRGMVIRSGF